jgi:PAS domain S-box-containing protein
VAKVAAGGQVERYVTRRRAKDGTIRIISLAVSPIRDASGRMLGVTKMAREVAS